MTFEELLSKYQSVSDYLADSTALSREEIELLFEFAWKQGYEFRIQEEELNKGASF